MNEKDHLNMIINACGKQVYVSHGLGIKHEMSIYTI